LPRARTLSPSSAPGGVLDCDTWLWLLREANSRLASKQRSKDGNFSLFWVVNRIPASFAVSSRALLGGDGGEGGPALLDVFAATVRTDDLSLFVVDERQDLRKELLALVAEEFVVGHTHLPQF